MIFFLRPAVLLTSLIILLVACGQKGPLFLPKETPEQAEKKPAPANTQPEPVMDDGPDYSAPGN